MTTLPQHKSSEYLESGIILRRISSPSGKPVPVTYAHQDDYYIFGLIESGTGCGFIDFKERHFRAGDIILIQPWQVHRFISSENADGWLLITDGSLIGNTEKYILDNFALFASSFPIDLQQQTELAHLASMLKIRLDNITDQQTKTTVRRLAGTFVSIIAEAIQHLNLQNTSHSPRHIEIVLTFRSLIAEHLAVNRKPSHYASLLNISTVYLNEIVRGVTGMSATSFIKNETILRAKRLLAHTDLTVKEIADSLGIDDHAYFSRLFAQTTGISPTAFRRLEGV